METPHHVAPDSDLTALAHPMPADLGVPRRSLHSLRASVIVLGYNGREYLEGAIASLLDQDFPKGAYEVIYVDNASTDGSAEHVAARFPDVRVLRNEQNLGFYRAFNRAALDAHGTYLVAVPQDVVAHQRWLSELVRVADEDERVLVAVTNTIAPGSADYRPSNRTGDVTECTWVRVSPLGYIELRRGLTSLLPRRTLACAGCSALLKRDLIGRTGSLFHEGLGHYAGDFELGLRASVAGGKVMQVPTAVIYHVGEEAKSSLDARVLWRYAAGSRDQVLTLFITMTNQELLIFLPFLFLGLSFKATTLRLPRLARGALFSVALALSPLVLLVAFVRARKLRDVRGQALARRQVDGYWLLRSIIVGVPT